MEPENETVTLDGPVRAYMRLVAREHIDGDDDVTDERDELWDRMTGPQRDAANALVLAIFEPWL